jgi:type I restriction enzyme M protein
VPPPKGRKKYSKTRQMRFEEFDDCRKWWKKRTENDRAWRVLASDVAGNGYNLDLRNPNRPDDLSHRPPKDLFAELVDNRARDPGPP